tara:strand:- start:969 stop:1190 length:222 start_codon:yes stop_codon:yes gene_type:complete
MITSDEKFYAQRDANFKQRVCNILFDDSIEHSENEALELIANLKQQLEDNDPLTITTFQEELEVKKYIKNNPI